MKAVVRVGLGDTLGKDEAHSSATDQTLALPRRKRSCREPARARLELVQLSSLLRYNPDARNRTEAGGVAVTHSA
jgi:hypothetical protein